MGAHFAELKTDLARFDERGLSLAGQLKIALGVGSVGILTGIGGIVTALLR